MKKKKRLTEFRMIQVSAEVHHRIKTEQPTIKIGPFATEALHEKLDRMKRKDQTTEAINRR